MVAILGKQIGSIGYGLMGLTWRPTPPPEEQAFKAMKAALNSGCNLWNAGEFYGTKEYNSLHLLQRYFSKFPEDASRVVLSIKGGLNNNMLPDGSPENVQQSVENCLRLLKGTKSIDIFEMARVDKNVPLKVTLNELEKCVQTGKIGGISLSEVSAATIKEAAGITKIVAVEVELSLWSTDVFRNGIAAACAEHNIPLIAYSPIGRGMLTGEIKSLSDIPEGDIRRHMPRFQPKAFATNLELVKRLQNIAHQKGCTPAQLAISWVRSLSEKDGNSVIIPIPGATTEERVLENASGVSITPEDLAQINSILETFEAVGGRYGGAMAAFMDG